MEFAPGVIHSLQLERTPLLGSSAAGCISLFLVTARPLWRVVYCGGGQGGRITSEAAPSMFAAKCGARF
eukprot:scaffold23336_cov20-Tisochrysis_lutea.AAC.1